MGGPAVVAQDLVKRYGGTRRPGLFRRSAQRSLPVDAVKGISFEVPRGSVFGFLGPNGAGKSTTMRMLYDLTPRTSGRLEVLGFDVERHGREVRRRIGVVPQEANLDADMTARENLLAFGRFFDLTGARLRDRADEMLAYVQLTTKAHTREAELSGGMKRRLLIARALMNDPELLILDEPTTGLDPQSRQLLWERIREQRRAGKTVILTTHYMDEAEKLSDDLVVIDGGRIIASGAPRALIEEHMGHEAVELTVAPEADAAIRARVGDAARHVERVGDDLRLFGDDGDEILQTALKGDAKVERHLVRRATLEDVFLKLTGRRLED